MTQGRCKRLLGGTPGVGLVNISVHLACISLYCCSFFAYSGLGKERKAFRRDYLALGKIYTMHVKIPRNRAFS